MKNNLITIFNQLTSSELADYTLFIDLLSNHYEKIKYLYSLIDSIELSNIDKIHCKSTSTSLRVFIEPHNRSYLNDMIYHINSNRSDYAFSKYFTLDVYESEGVLRIDIAACDDMKEGDIYDNRFI